MNEIAGILSRLRPDIELEGQERLIDDGVLDSFDMVALVAELNLLFDIEIGVHDLVPENFNSVAAMHVLIQHKQDEA